MKRRSAQRLGWLMLCVWAVLLVSLQSRVAELEGLRTWTPELGVVFLVALAGHAHFRSLLLAAYWIALARIAFSVETPAELLAAYLAVALALRSLSTVFELKGLLTRLCTAGLAAWLFGWWLDFVRDWHSLPSALPSSELAGRPPLGALILSTALATALLAPALRHLPGLSPLSDSGYSGRLRVRLAAPPLARSFSAPGKGRPR